MPVNVNGVNGVNGVATVNVGTQEAVAVHGVGGLERFECCAVKPASAASSTAQHTQHGFQRGSESLCCAVTDRDRERVGSERLLVTGPAQM